MKQNEGSRHSVKNHDTSGVLGVFTSEAEHLTDTVAHNFYRIYGKRLFDIIFAICGLIVCIVPMIIIAIFVRLTSPGPAFFCQLRAGKKGRLFVLYKFRSMYINAPEKSNQDFTPGAMKHYVTKLGQFMRKTSVDELPQMINVLHGEMSFVGPRPLAKTDSRVLELRAQSGADQVRPGITGLAQINGRNEITDEEKAAWDCEYEKNVSLVTDIKIIFMSFWVIVKQKGINKHTTNQD